MFARFLYDHRASAPDAWITLIAGARARLLSARLAVRRIEKAFGQPTEAIERELVAYCEDLCKQSPPGPSITLRVQQGGACHGN